MLPSFQDFKDIYLSVMAARFGVCIPSGCSEAEAEINYALLYEPYDINAVALTCSTKAEQEEIHDLDAVSYVAM